jgi:hypothetical protein
MAAKAATTLARAGVIIVAVRGRSGAVDLAAIRVTHAKPRRI